MGFPGFGTFIQTNGAIVIAGTMPSIGQGFFTRVVPNGSALDTTFNSSGVTPGLLILNIAGGSAINFITIQPDGKIIGVGTASGNSLLIRLNTDGSFDTTFNGGNPVLTPSPVAGLLAELFDVVLDKTGKITVVGVLSTIIETNPHAPMTTADMLIARYNSDGTLDTTFNGSGQAELEVLIGGTDAVVTVGSSIDIQADQKLIVGGYVILNSGELPFFLAR